MKKIMLLGLVLVIGIFFAIKLARKTTVIEINGVTIEVEIADSTGERARGLMFRERLDENKGMLFVFPNEKKHSFWMANTKIPLDIIWINSEKKIVHIEKNVQPCKETTQNIGKCPSYMPKEPAKYVLEVNGGWVERNSVKIGSEVSI